MEQNEKKIKGKKVAAITAIICLAIFNMLPPIFRQVFPKPEETKTVKVTKKNQVLKCSKNVISEGYTVTSSFKYENNEPIKNTIIFKTLTEEEKQSLQTTDSNTETTTQIDQTTKESVSTRTITEEIAFFKEILKDDLSQGETTITAIIDKEVITENKSNLELANYFMSLKKQQAYYENQNYSCEIIRLQ